MSLHQTSTVYLIDNNISAGMMSAHRAAYPKAYAKYKPEDETRFLRTAEDFCEDIFKAINQLDKTTHHAPRTTRQGTHTSTTHHTPCTQHRVPRANHHTIPILNIKNFSARPGFRARQQVPVQGSMSVTIW